MRMDASWSGRYGATGYKVAARVPRAPIASSPRIRRPDTTGVPCARVYQGAAWKQWKVGAKRWPALTVRARARFQHAWVVAKKPNPGRTKESGMKKVKNTVETVLDRSGFVHVAPRLVAQPPKSAFVIRLRSGQFSSQTARQLPDLSAIIWVDSSSVRGEGGNRLASPAESCRRR